MRVTRRTRVLMLCGMLPWAASLACVFYTPVVTRPPTLGDELISLDQARKDGLLTQEEFDKRRAETIEVWKQIGTTPIVDANAASGAKGASK